jgi:hypothetical protein
VLVGGTRIRLAHEASLKCRSTKKGRFAPPVHIIKLTKSGRSRLTLRCIRMMRREGPAGWNRGDPYDHFNQRRPASPRLCRQRIALAS